MKARGGAGRSPKGEKLQKRLGKWLKLKDKEPKAKELIARLRQDVMTSRTALHSPDQVAGGPPDPNEQGMDLVNSTIGQQWTASPNRVDPLKTGARKIADKDRERTQMFVRLDVAESQSIRPGTSPLGRQILQKFEQYVNEDPSLGNDPAPDDKTTK